MKLTIQPTDQVVRLNGVECRVWTGADEHGTRADLFVARVAILESNPPAAIAAFTQALKERRTPPEAERPLNYWPTRMVLPDE